MSMIDHSSLDGYVDVTAFEIYELNWKNSKNIEQKFAITLPVETQFSKGMVEKKEGNTTTRSHDLASAKSGIPLHQKQITPITFKTTSEKTSDNMITTSSRSSMVALSIIEVSSSKESFFESFKKQDVQLMMEDASSITILTAPVGWDKYTSYGTLEKYLFRDGVAVCLSANMFKFTHDLPVEESTIYHAFKKVNLSQ